MERSEQILEFWFGPLSDDGWGFERKRLDYWFNGGPAVDAELRERFGDDLAAAERGELDPWAETPRGRLALVIILDQFSRNIHRGKPEAWDNDPKTARLVVDAVEKGMDRRLAPIERSFFYLPLEHAEDRELQRRAVELYGALAKEAPPEWKENYDSFLDYAVRHQVIIERFGRFPHRNAILGRETTEEEAAFLLTPGSSF